MSAGIEQVYDRIAGRLRGRKDTEHIQAIIRVVLISLVALYLNSDFAGERGPYAVWGDRMAVGYTLAALVLVGWIVADPRVSVFRRYLAMVMEHSLESLCLILEGERAAPLFLIYVWVSLGNGFRYGVRPLLWSTAVSTVGFCLVIVFSDFFRSILPVSIGMAMTLVAIPLYAASLIRQLHDAKITAEQANRAKSRFLATASHELRTPLHSIIGLSDLLQSTGLTADQAEMIRTVRNSGDTLLNLVEDVLDISSIEAGRMVSYTVDFDLFASVAETVAIVRTQAMAKELRLGLTIAADTPGDVTGDWKHLRQILLNLLTNAIKFTKDGSIGLSVSRSPDLRGAVRFTISDTGIGIDAKHITRIFDTFVQTDESVTRTHGGVGLGLAIVRQIVTLLGGTIHVASTLGIGSRFIVDVPLVERKAVDHIPACQPLLYTRDPALAARLRSDRPDLEVIDDPVGTPAASNLPLVILVDERDHRPTSIAILPAVASLPVSFVAITASDAASTDDNAVTSFPALDSGRELSSMLRIAAATAYRRELPKAAIALDSPPVEAGTSTTDGAGRRILVVDDSAVNRMVTDKILRSDGFETVLAENAETALDILDEQEFDALLLDINMPGQSGIDVIKTYNFMRVGMKMPPIAVFSAEVTEDMRQECLGLGVALFLPKPSEPKVILSRLKALIDPGHPQPKPLFEPAKIEIPKASDLVQAGGGQFPILDRHAIRSLIELGKGAGFLRELADEFDHDAEGVLIAIDRAVQQRDLPEFWDQVHALRSSAANVGASQIFNKCMEASGRGRASFLTHGTAYATSLRQEYVRFTRTMRRLLKEEPHGMGLVDQAERA